MVDYKGEIKQIEARKEHKCHICGTIIAKGVFYWQGEFGQNCGSSTFTHWISSETIQKRYEYLHKKHGFFDEVRIIWVDEDNPGAKVVEV